MTSISPTSFALQHAINTAVRWLVSVGPDGGKRYQPVNMLTASAAAFTEQDMVQVDARLPSVLHDILKHQDLSSVGGPLLRNALAYWRDKIVELPSQTPERRGCLPNAVSKFNAISLHTNSAGVWVSLAASIYIPRATEDGILYTTDQPLNVDLQYPRAYMDKHFPGWERRLDVGLAACPAPGEVAAHVFNALPLPPGQAHDYNLDIPDGLS